MRDQGSQACTSQTADIETGNILPLMHEVRHALQAFLSDGTETVIDLRALPMGPGEEQRLAELLGSGEVRVTLDALGSSEIAETKFPGVWLSTHCNESGEQVGRYIEICAVPVLVKAQHDDVRAGLGELAAMLDERQQD